MSSCSSLRSRDNGGPQWPRLKRIQTFDNSCLRIILGVWWPETTNNEWLWQRTCQMLVEHEIRQRRWRWIGHTHHKPVNSIIGQALTWNPQGKSKGQPRNMWHCDLEADVKETGYNWAQLERLTEDRNAWQNYVEGWQRLWLMTHSIKKCARE